jgi:hypothetical protein
MALINTFDYSRILYADEYQNKQTRIISLNTIGAVFVAANGDFNFQPNIDFQQGVSLLAMDWMVKLTDNTTIVFNSDVSEYLKPTVIVRGELDSENGFTYSGLQQYPTASTSVKILPFSKNKLNYIEWIFLDNINNFPELAAFDPSTGNLGLDFYVELLVSF